METTPRLSLPLIQPGQALKHITHNEALIRLDMMSAVSVLSDSLSEPPVTVTDGDSYRVAVAGTGAWSGLDGQIVMWIGTQWNNLPSPEGLLAFVRDSGIWTIRTDTGWEALNRDAATDFTAQSLSVNTTADPHNRVSMKTRSMLVSHDDVTPEGGDVRLSLNKQSESDTASLLLTNGYQSCAEIGLVGTDDLSIRVSADGQTFLPALTISSTTGAVSLPQGLAGPVALSGQPVGSLSAYDELYLDPVGGDDANDGRSAATAVRTIAGLTARFRIGRWLRVFLLGDIDWDQYVPISYPLHKMTFAGVTSAGTYTKRKIIIQNATNVPGYPGCLAFECHGNIEFVSVDIELASASVYPFLLFNGTTGFVTTENMVMTRTGSGAGHILGTGRCFVPNFHTNLTVDASAAGYVAYDVPAGGDPNARPNFISNITSM